MKTLQTFLKPTALAFASLFPFLSCSASFLAEDLERLTQTKACPQGQLSGSDLSGRQDLLNLRGASLVDANLQDTNLIKDMLFGADLRRAQLPDALQELDVWNVPGRTFFVSDGGEEIDLPKRFTFDAYDALHRRANQGDAFAQFAAAFLLETYGTLDEDKATARTFYEQAVAQDYWPAINNLGWMYEWGYGVERDLSTAYDFYEKAARHNLMASFNVTRFQAVYRQSREAFYSLGAKYKSGNGVPEDMALAFHWLHQAADQGHVKACRYAGVMCRSGTGTPRDFDRAFAYLQTAADPQKNGAGTSGDPESQYELGRLYETGQGVEQDFEQARFWYHKASAIDHTGALMHLGKLYEEGKGGEASYEEALKCYQKLSVQGRVSGMYNQGRMLEYFLGDNSAQKAVQLYQSVLKKDPTHTGALFLLGIHLQKGAGIKKNISKAKDLYQKAAEAGHGLAKLRAYLLQNRGQVDDEEIREHRRLFEDLRARSQKDEARITGELSQNYRISNFNLTNDYEECFKLLEAAEETYQAGPRINFKALPFDPYVGEMTFLEPVTPEESTPHAVDILCQAIREAGKENPALTEALLEDLFMVSQAMSAPASQTLRERFVRLYKAWVSEERGLPVPDEVIDRLKYRQGRVAQKLAQNIGRCGDGLSSFFSEEEVGFALPEEREVPMGLRLALSLLQYKQRFLDQHLVPNPESNNEVERNTEASVLAFQRLRLPLGLPGVFTDPLYPAMGHGNSVIYRPDRMMKRFFNGGRIDFDATNDSGRPHRVTTIQPFTVQNVCRYLQEIINDPDNKLLTKNHVSDFVLKDSVLKRAGEEAFIDFEANDYCDPFVEPNASPYKAKTFERLLALHGYVIYPEGGDQLV